MSDPQIQAQRQKLRSLASSNNPVRPRSRMYQIGTETKRCDCGGDGVVKADCERCAGKGEVTSPAYVEVRQPSASVTSSLLKVSSQKVTLTELPTKNADGKPMQSITVEGDQTTFNAYATFYCTYVPDTNIRVWDAQADLDRMLEEPHDQKPQSEIGPIVDAIMKEVKKTEGKG